MRFPTAACSALILTGLLGSSVQADQSQAPIAGSGTSAKPTRITTDQLEIATYVTDDSVVPGAVFSVVFDVTPRQGIHVYAPGAKDYKIIEVKLEPNPRIVMRPVQYPESEIYVFAPLKERVPVFQRQFRLEQPMAVSAAPEHRAALAKAGMVAIKGALNYQACDDRICFPPKAVPVSYRVKVRPPGSDRDRAAR